MLSVLLLLLTTQVLCSPGETTAVCQCKQGAASACAALEPKELEKVEQALQAAKQAEEQLRQQEAAKAAEPEAQASSSAPEPPDCKGQQHHIISRPIAKALEEHETLRGHYQPRDPRFVSRAVDEKAHCGYQEWHRDVDREVIEWLKTNDKVTPKQFEEFLHSIYKRPEMRARFPNGF